MYCQVNCCPGIPGGHNLSGRGPKTGSVLRLPEHALFLIVFEATKKSVLEGPVSVRPLELHLRTPKTTKKGGRGHPHFGVHALFWREYWETATFVDTWSFTRY